MAILDQAQMRGLIKKLATDKNHLIDALKPFADAADYCPVDDDEPYQKWFLSGTLRKAKRAIKNVKSMDAYMVTDDTIEALRAENARLERGDAILRDLAKEAQEAALDAIEVRNAAVAELEALRAENARLREATLEEAAKIAEKVRDDFLSEEYAVPQPIGSIQERFACTEVAAAIRAAMGESDE